MARTEALNRAIKKYDAEKVDRIIFRVTKGKKEALQEYAAQNGESLSGFINRAIDETMQRDLEKKKCP